MDSQKYLIKFVRFLEANKFTFTLIVVYLVTTALSLSRYLINWDSGQFALATINYDIANHQPQPPGYFLFIYVGKFINFFFHNINLSFTLIAALAGLLAVYFFYKTATIITNSKLISFWVTLAFVSSPLFWYYRSIALTYTFEALATTLAVYITLLIARSNEWLFWKEMAAFALIAGFRLDIILSVAPFVLIQMFLLRRKPRIILLGWLLFFVVFAVWFIPMVWIVGGIKKYWNFTFSQFYNVSFSGRWSDRYIQLKFFLEVAWWSLGLVFFVFLIRVKTFVYCLRQRRWFKWILLPAVCLTFFYNFSHFGQAGYFLSILPLAMLLLVPILESNRNLTTNLIFSLLVIFNLFVFLTAPTFFRNKKVAAVSLRGIKEYDYCFRQTSGVLKSLDPKKTLIILDNRPTVNVYKDVCWNSNIRVLSYYFPDYRIIELRENNTYFQNNGIKAKSYSTPNVLISSTLTRLVVFNGQNSIATSEDLLLERKMVLGWRTTTYQLGDITDSVEFFLDGFIFKKIGI